MDAWCEYCQFSIWSILLYASSFGVCAFTYSDKSNVSSSSIFIFLYFSAGTIYSFSGIVGLNILDNSIHSYILLYFATKLGFILLLICSYWLNAFFKSSFVFCAFLSTPTNTNFSFALVNATYKILISSASISLKLFIFNALLLIVSYSDISSIYFIPNPKSWSYAILVL